MYVEENQKAKFRPAVLVVLDGFGVAGVRSAGNAISLANKPNFDFFLKNYSFFTVHAAGEMVGLKWGEIGNSEVGHLSIGSGRIIYQPQVKIDKYIIDGSFFKNNVLNNAMKTAEESGKNIHIIGLLSDTGVHASIEHLYALLEMASQYNIQNCYIHAILDGRDSMYNGGIKYMEHLLNKTKDLGIGEVATISGRFWAMDRNNKWDRIEKAYNAIVNGESDKLCSNPLECIKESYRNSVFDEEFEPTVMVDEDNNPKATVNDGDVVIFYNFRPDRARQLSKALSSDNFTEFKRKRFPKIKFVTFTKYADNINSEVVFPVDVIKNPLGSVLSQRGLKQLHIAETEKYAHVTYFINGGREEPFEGEDRVLIPSPSVGFSYEEKPEMSAFEIRDKVIENIQKDSYDFYIVNFANVDMVGHTGNIQATIKAVETVDQCLGDIYNAIKSKGGILFITADHGNAEQMINTISGEINKKHSSHPVPFLIINDLFKRDKPLEEVPDLSTITPAGFLSDISPTILTILGIPVPKDMTGASLV